MSKHEIRLRRQRLTSHGSERFRNYGAVLERHEQEQKMRKIFRVFGYFLVILIIILLIVIVTRVEKKVAPKGPAQTAAQVSRSPVRQASTALSLTELPKDLEGDSVTLSEVEG